MITFEELERKTEKLHNLIEDIEHKSHKKLVLEKARKVEENRLAELEELVRPGNG